MKLYELSPTRSVRARWMLQELGIPFEAITVDLTQGEHQTPAYKQINPAGKIPTLIDGDFVLTESIAIALYLAEKAPGRAFVPKDLRVRAEMYRWLLFTVTELEQPLFRITRNTFVYPEAERSASDVVIASREFKEMAAVLEAHMHGRKYVAGDHVTLCDFMLAYTLDWGHTAGLLGDFPRLQGYMESMYKRPKAPPRIAEVMASRNSS